MSIYSLISRTLWGISKFSPMPGRQIYSYLAPSFLSFLFFFYLATPGSGSQGLLLTLCSGITLGGGAQGTTWGTGHHEPALAMCKARALLAILSITLA